MELLLISESMEL